MENTSFLNGGQAPLPNSGRFSADRWAQIIGIEERALRDNCAKLNIRVLRFGRATFIDAEWFWSDLTNTDGVEEE